MTSLNWWIFLQKDLIIRKGRIIVGSIQLFNFSGISVWLIWLDMTHTDYSLDPFRNCIERINGHYNCLEDYCVYCHIKTLLSEYQHNEQLSIPPDALRNALATSCSQSFQSGNLGDPVEAYQAVLDRLHEQLVENEPEGQCSALHCVVHRKFSCNIVEMFQCSDPR